MRSPTQQVMAPDDVRRLVRQATGQEAVELGELSGGGFASVWAALLDDGAQVVAKVGPPASASLLGYERDLPAAEAAYLRALAARAPEVPVPRVLAAVDNWLVMERLPGVSLPGLPAGADTDVVRAGLGAAIARVHRVLGDRFGYSGARPCASSWPAAFGAIVEALLEDARGWQVAVPAARIRTAVAAGAAALAEVREPAVLHFDLWDGNVLAVADGSGGWQFSGLVDGERWLCGDPLMDFVSPALLQRIEEQPEHPFLRGYSVTTGHAVTFDDAARHRLALYRCHLYLLMLAEMPSRGMDPDGEWAAHLRTVLDEELRRLGHPR